MFFKAISLILVVVAVGLSVRIEPVWAGSVLENRASTSELELMRAFEKGQIGVGLQINGDGQVLARPRWKNDGKLYYLTQGLKDETLIAPDLDFIGLFEFRGRIFGVLSDLRLIEFMLMRPRMVNGSFKDASLPLAAAAAAAGCMAFAATCSWMGWDTLATVYSVSSVAPIALVYSIQRRCQLNVEVWALGGLDMPVFVSELQLDSQKDLSSRLPRVKDVRIHLGRLSRTGRLLSEYLQAEDACADLLVRRQANYTE